MNAPKTEICEAFIAYFSKHEPNPKTALAYQNPYQLLMAVILSAQCTDQQVNKVTPALFAQYPTPFDLAQAEVDTLYQYIKSITYPKAKAQYLIQASKTLVQEFQGIIPKDVQNLQRLKGVGRKTAHVVLSVLHDYAVLAVDTHVARTAKRLGLVSTNAKTPRDIEKELLSLLPLKYVSRSHHWFISLGRRICKARRPACQICPLSHVCVYFRQNLI